MTEPPLLKSSALLLSSLSGCDVSRRSELLRVIESSALHPVFQPIVDLEREAVIGHEGLIRGPSNSYLHAPVQLFSAAEEFDLVLPVERACRRATVLRYAELGAPGYLFLNVSPKAIVAAGFKGGETKELLASIGLSPLRIVIELTETHPAHDYEALGEAVAHYRQYGFRIAIDDLGEGFSNLRMWSELRPEFVKIDKHFIEDLHLDPVKQEFVRAILHLAQQSGTQAIAEGIETETELRMLRQLGLRLGQGFLLGRPSPALSGGLPFEAAQALGQHVRARRAETPLGQARQQTGTLVRDARPITPDTLNDAVYERFQSEPTLHAIPVVNAEGVPVGLMRRYAFLEHFARPFNRELFGKRPCTALMDARPLIVDHALSLASLSQLVVAAEQRHLIDGFIITREGRYLGMGTGYDLMRAMTELQINTARYANPLTQLPGNVPVNEQIDYLLDQQTPFVAAYIDLNHFKPYNDVYGYARGDEIILLTARLLREHCDPVHDFIGHIGGDDFMVLFQSPDWSFRCQTIIDRFDDVLRPYVEPAHREAGGYVTQSRQGQPVFHSLVSLAIGAVRVEPGTYASHLELSHALSQAKREAKKGAHGALFVERRRHRPHTAAD
jgi:diguanylate cyclase (GGDEF)-like protein